MIPSAMKLLTFLARRFAWSAHVASDAPATVEQAAPGALEECVVVFVHAERADEQPARRASTLRQAAKHVQWLARKRDTRRCVLHSFTHLGGETSESRFAAEWMGELAQRLQTKGFEVAQTPFGHSCAWELAVHGEPLARSGRSCARTRARRAERPRLAG
jgi:hypothetical protein